MAHKAQQPFFDFVMTTSNHKPYTYPEGKIDIPSGTSRARGHKIYRLCHSAVLENCQDKAMV